MLEFQQLTAGYGKRPVLHNITLTLRPSEVTVLGGLNGCGKSTLLKTASGLLPPLAGQVLLDGRPLQAYTSQQRAQRMAYLPQGRSVPELTAFRMVLHGRFAYLGFPRQYRREDYEAARAALEWVGCAALAERSMAALSGGERQKVYIAMALAQDTGIILMDEPTTYLDIRARFEVMDLARHLAALGKTVVLVLHDLDLTMRYAQRVILLADGGIAADGAPAQICSNGSVQRVYGVEAVRAELPGGGEEYVFRPGRVP